MCIFPSCEYIYEYIGTWVMFTYLQVKALTFWEAILKKRASKHSLKSLELLSYGNNWYFILVTYIYEYYPF